MLFLTHTPLWLYALIVLLYVLSFASTNIHPFASLSLCARCSIFPKAHKEHLLTPAKPISLYLDIYIMYKNKGTDNKERERERGGVRERGRVREQGSAHAPFGPYSLSFFISSVYLLPASGVRCGIPLTTGNDTLILSDTSSFLSASYFNGFPEMGHTRYLRVVS